MRFRQLGSSDLQVSEICPRLLAHLRRRRRGRPGGGVCRQVRSSSGSTSSTTANVYARRQGGGVPRARARRFARAARTSSRRSSSGRCPTGGSGPLPAKQVHTQVDNSLAPPAYRVRRPLPVPPATDWDGTRRSKRRCRPLTEVVAGGGRRRYIGFSEWPAEKIEEAVTMAGVEKFVSSQPQYSMIWRGIERDVIDVCERNGISQIVWSPLAQGVLTGKYRPGRADPRRQAVAVVAEHGHVDGQARATRRFSSGCSSCRRSQTSSA